MNQAPSLDIRNEAPDAGCATFGNGEALPPLDGHVAIVTGSATGIGRAIAEKLAARGASVVLNYRSDKTAALDAIRLINEAAGADSDAPRAVAVQGDTGDLASHERLIATALENFGRLDLLVNNAGTGIRKPFLETTPADWDRVMTPNLKGACFLAQAAARAMLTNAARRNGAAGAGDVIGKIINISSVHETRAMMGNSVYCISKAGMKMLTEALALELAPSGIAVIGVSPGAILTEATKRILADDAYKQKTLAKIPARRIGAAADVAEAVAFFASPQCRYVTGSTLTIDGGMLLL
ncbi:MAG: glucose 1-dehydrogenase [Opitutaceae bacterium]|jgi:NAD(P)-dependent dehydrogenase (short-subunit alcohol dehydrogenase family)|nr:glucose 1-dehydrogenase [Opitutaceae bacterium]